MNPLIFERSTGLLRASEFARIHNSRRLQLLQPFPKIRFDGGHKVFIPDEDEDQPDENHESRYPRSKIWAHQSGVNALALDIENKILVSGGADSSLSLWDLDEYNIGSRHIFKPIASVERTASAHKYGITQLSFYPFDSAAFLSSSYDHHLKVYATETQQVSADFNLDTIVYAHTLSPIADHLLVACATQHPAVRLVDLRSGSNTHSLAGHAGALLSLAWSPTVEHILASGGIDGTIRLWDIRKSSGSLGTLDMQDGIGVAAAGGATRSRLSAKSHQGAVNGLTWTGDGCYIISAGHDQKVRVWNAATGANTLASFGPTLRNGHLSTLPLVMSPTSSTAARKDLLFYPNQNEILVFELHHGKLLKRLRIPGPNVATVRSRTGERNVRNRITALVWKGQSDGIYSAHTDGQIRAWCPRTEEDDVLEAEEENSKRSRNDDETDEGKRKREVLETVFRDLTRQKITFG